MLVKGVHDGKLVETTGEIRPQRNADQREIINHQCRNREIREIRGKIIFHHRTAEDAEYAEESEPQINADERR